MSGDMGGRSAALSRKPVPAPGHTAARRQAGRICLGHALGGKNNPRDVHAVEEAVRIAAGESRLEPRDPAVPDAVFRAETLLGAIPRPVYAFVGDLHPELGSVGLIISRRWSERATQGVTRCDSGGLACGAGGFQFIETAIRDDALRSLSTPVTFAADDWDDRFAEEVSESYPEPAAYVDGAIPETAHWGDPRAECLTRTLERDRTTGSDVCDRRLWTWEVRLDEAPEPSEIEALVVSHGAKSHLHTLVTREGLQVPLHVKVLAGSNSHSGIEHWFSAPTVREAFFEAEDTPS